MMENKSTNKALVTFSIDKLNLQSTVYNTEFDTVFHELTLRTGESNRIVKAVLKANLSNGDFSVDTFGLNDADKEDALIISNLVEHYETLTNQAKDIFEAGGRGYAGFTLVRDFLHEEVILQLKEEKTLMNEAA